VLTGGHIDQPTGKDVASGEDENKDDQMEGDLET
jgi:hypothetical protein